MEPFHNYGLNTVGKGYSTELIGLTVTLFIGTSPVFWN